MPTHVDLGDRHQLALLMIGQKERPLRVVDGSDLAVALEVLDDKNILVRFRGLYIENRQVLHGRTALYCADMARMRPACHSVGENCFGVHVNTDI